MKERGTGTPRERLYDPRLWLSQVIVVAVAVPLAFFPALYASLGLQEFGGERGWWEPPPASNAGEMVPVLLLPSAVLLSGILAITAVIVYRAVRERGHSVRAAVVGGLLSLLGVFSGVWVAGMVLISVR